MPGGFSVTITATDKATATVNKVNAAFAGMSRRVVATAAPFERFGGAVKQLGETSGVTRLARGIGDVGGRIAGATASLGRFAPGLAAITSAGTIAGLAKLVETWTGFGARLGLDAQRINTTAASLHSMQGAARLAGSSAEALTDGMRTLGDNLVDAVGGRSPETVQMLSTLGIGFRDAATGGARLADDVLPEVADRIKALRTPALQARAATALFGGAGEALLPFLRKGAAGIAEYNDQARAYGVVNAAGVAAANRMREAQARLGLAAEGVGYTIAERVSPVLVPLLDRLSSWVANHREDIGRFFEDVARRIQAWVDTGGIDRVVTAVSDFGTTVKTVSDGLGGAMSTIELFFGLWVGFKAVAAIASVVRMAAALKALNIARAAGTATAAGGVGGLGVRAAIAAAGPGAAILGGIALAHQAMDPLTEGQARRTDVMLGGPQDGFGVDGRPVEDINRNLEKIDQHLLNIGAGGSGGGGAGGGAAGGGFRPTPGTGGAPQASPGQMKPILDLVGQAEGTDRGRGYNESLGYGRWTGGAQNLTGMTLDQIDKLQTSMLDRQRAAGIGDSASSALGRYQFTRTTLRDMRKRMGLDGSTVFDERMQDRLATERINSSGGANRQNLANIWASFPDPRTGRSVYGQGVGTSGAAVDKAIAATRPIMAAPAPPVMPAPLPLQAAGVRGQDGTSVVRVELAGFPKDTRSSVTSQNGMRIEHQTLGNVP